MKFGQRFAMKQMIYRKLLLILIKNADEYQKQIEETRTTNYWK